MSRWLLCLALVVLLLISIFEENARSAIIATLTRKTSFLSTTITWNNQLFVDRSGNESFSRTNQPPEQTGQITINPTKHLARRFVVGVFREGPTKHVDSVNMMIEVAKQLNRTFVEPCYMLSGNLGPCGGLNVIPFCDVFMCDIDLDVMITSRDFKKQNTTSLSRWVLSTRWGYTSKDLKVVMKDLPAAKSDTAQVMHIRNIIKGTFPIASSVKWVKFEYSSKFIGELAYPELPYAVLQWRSEKNVQRSCDYNKYIQCARWFREQIEMFSENMKAVYVVWDAHLENEHNWGHLNMVIPKKHRVDAHSIIMAPLSNDVAIKRIAPSGNIVKDMMIDHVVASGASLLVLCLSGKCLDCSFNSGFSLKMRELFQKKHQGTLIDAWRKPKTGQPANEGTSQQTNQLANYSSKPINDRPPKQTNAGQPPNSSQARGQPASQPANQLANQSSKSMNEAEKPVNEPISQTVNHPANHSSNSINDQPPKQITTAQLPNSSQVAGQPVQLDKYSIKPMNDQPPKQTTSDQTLNASKPPASITPLVIPKGNLSSAVAEYFYRFFPTRRRVDFVESDSGVLMLPRTEFIPSCFVAMSGQTFSRNVEPRFANPISKEAEFHYSNLEYDRKRLQESEPPAFKVLHGGQALRQESPTSLILTIYPQASDRKPPFEALLDDSSCKGKLCVMKVTSELSNDFVSKEHLWPSGASVHDDQGQLHYLVHNRRYDAKHLVKNGSASFQRVATPGFEGLGGENIGSLFLHKGRVYAAARVALKYHFHAWSGHGYRHAAIWNISDGSLVSMFDDRPCGSTCGYKEDLAPTSCEMDNSKFEACTSDRPASNSRNQSLDLTVGKRCFRRAAGSGTDCGNLFEYFKCVEKCRGRNEIYHSAATHHKGLLIAIAAKRDNNLLFCRLGDATLNFACWPTPLMKLKQTREGHPLMTQLGLTLENIYMIEQKLQKRNRGTIVHSWNRKEFCSMRAMNDAAPAELWIHLRVESGTFDGFRLFWQNDLASGVAGRDSKLDLDLKSFINVTLKCGNKHVPLREEFEMKSLVSAYSFFAIECAMPFQLVLVFSRLSFIGIAK